MQIKLLTVCVLLLSLMACSPKPDQLRRLGSNPFTTEAWAKAGQEQRGTMVHDLIVHFDVIGMPVQDLKKLLGESTAYYNYDEIPAYVIGPPTIHSDLANGYVIAFPFDRKTERISSYEIVPGLE